jgi:arylsulfatase
MTTRADRSQGLAIQAVIAKWIESFKGFPPRARAASFTVSDVMETITTASAHQN